MTNNEDTLKIVKTLIYLFMIFELLFYGSAGDKGIDEGSHIGYIISLADSNFASFGDRDLNYYASDPPLYYLIGASLYKIIYYTHSVNSQEIILMIKRLSSFIILLIVFLLFKSIDLLTNNNLIRITAYSSTAFHPTFIFNSARISSDMLVTLLTTALFYLMIKHIDETEIGFKKSLKIGILIGLGILSKQLMLAFIPIFFIYFFIRYIKHKNLKKESISFFIILIIIIPVISWYYIFNYVHYGVFFLRKNIDLESEKKQISLFEAVSKLKSFQGIAYIKNNFVHHYGNLGVNQIYMHKTYYFTFLFFIFLAGIGIFFKFLSAYKNNKLNDADIILLLLITMIAVTVLGITQENFSYYLKGTRTVIMRSGLFNHLMLAESLILGYGLTNIFKSTKLTKILISSFIIFTAIANLSALFYYFIPYYLFGVILY